MQRDWDAELIEDRTFKVGGELFEWKYPHWEVGAKLFDDDLTPAEQNGDEQPQFSWVSDTKFAIDGIIQFLDPKNDSVKRFKALVTRKNDPVPRFQLVQIYKWLWAVTQGLPTPTPSLQGSGGGVGATDTGSSDASFLQEATSTA